MLERRSERPEIAVCGLLEGLGPRAVEAQARLRRKALVRGGPDEIVDKRHAGPGLARKPSGDELIERRLHSLLRPAFDAHDLVDRRRPACDGQEGDQLGGVGSGKSEPQVDDVVCLAITLASGENGEPERRAGGLRPELRRALRRHVRRERASKPDPVVAIKPLELRHRELTRVREDVS